jgi:hypothetical protein
MRTRFDQLAKDLSAAALGRGAKPGVTVTTAPQSYDLWFDPDPREAAALAERGMLGRMGQEPFGFEAFHQAPSVGEMRECVRKHLAFHHLRELKAKRELPLAKLWVVCAGRPEAMLAGYPMRRAKEWPAGVYEADALLNLWVAVVPELPKTRETLAVRLMGRGRELKAATTELVELPRETWERERLLPILVRWRFEVPADPAERNPEEDEFMASAQQLFETFERDAVRRGVQLGRKEGVQLGRKEGVALGEAKAVVTLLRGRGIAVGAGAEKRILACRDAHQLERWLVQATTVKHVRELFATGRPRARAKKAKAH